MRGCSVCCVNEWATNEYNDYVDMLFDIDIDIGSISRWYCINVSRWCEWFSLDEWMGRVLSVCQVCVKCVKCICDGCECECGCLIENATWVNNCGWCLWAWMLLCVIYTAYTLNTCIYCIVIIIVLMLLNVLCFIPVCNMYCIILQGCSKIVLNKTWPPPSRDLCYVSMPPQPIRTNPQHAFCLSI